MNKDDLQRTYEALLARYEAGELDSEAFLEQVQALTYRDEQGRLWSIGARTGHWYVLHKGRWVQADPAPVWHDGLGAAPSSAPAAQAEPLEPPRRSCPACKSEVPEGAAYCPYCGHALGDAPAARGGPEADVAPESGSVVRVPEVNSALGRAKLPWARLVPWLAGLLLLVGGAALAAVYWPAPAPPRVAPSEETEAVPSPRLFATGEAFPEGEVLVVQPEADTLAPVEAREDRQAGTAVGYTLTFVQPEEGSVWSGPEVVLRWACTPGLVGGQQFLVRVWRAGWSAPLREVRTSQTHYVLEMEALGPGLYQWQVQILGEEAFGQAVSTAARRAFAWAPGLTPTSTLLHTIKTATATVTRSPSPSPTAVIPRAWSLISPSEGPEWVHGEVVTLRWQCNPGLAVGEEFSLRIVHEGSSQPVVPDYRTTSTSYDFRPDPLKTGRYDWEVLIVRADSSQIVDRQGWHFSWAPRAPSAEPTPVAATATSAPVPPPSPTEPPTPAPEPTNTPAPPTNPPAPPTNTPEPPRPPEPPPLRTPEPTNPPVPTTLPGY